MKRKDYAQSGHKSLWERKAEIEQEKKSFKQRIVFLLIIIIIIGIIYLLIFSKVFQIKKIIISGSDRVEEITEIEEITHGFLDQSRFLILPQKNTFVLSKAGLVRLLKKRFDLDSADIKTKLPATLKIEIKHKIPSLIWQTNNKYFTVYNDGIIKAEISANGYELPIVSCGSSNGEASTTTAVQIGDRVVSDFQMEYIKKLFSLFNFYFKDFQINNFMITNLQSREVRLITSENWYILFSLDNDTEQSLDVLQMILDQKIQDRTNLQYVDLRVKDKIYYK